MKKSVEVFAQDNYPETIASQVVYFHLFGIESIDDQLNGSPWTIAHQIFDGKSIPCLISSDLRYEPEIEKHAGETLTGSVRARLPELWRHSTTPQILTDLKEFIDDSYISNYSLESSINGRLLEVFDEDGSCIALIDGESDEASVVLRVDVRLQQPEDKNEYYESVKQSVELWGYLHDFIAYGGVSDDVPMRYIRGHPQHDIYVGGAQPLPTITEMDLALILEELDHLDSDLPTPVLGNIDFEEVEDIARMLDSKDIIDSLKYVISTKRLHYANTHSIDPISTIDLVYAMNRQLELLQQSPDGNNHRD